MRNHVQALAEPSQSILQSEGFFNESTMRQSTQRLGSKRSQRELGSLKKTRDHELSQRLKKS